MNTCCCIGHRKIRITDNLLLTIKSEIEKLIDSGVSVFLFGSKSQFDILCLQIVTKLKSTYPFISRVYVRAEYEYIDDSYRDYILENYESTYFPDNAIHAGKLSYIKRNEHLIDHSEVCLFYCDDRIMQAAKSPYGKSGTKIAYDYAVRKHKKIINVFV